MSDSVYPRLLVFVTAAVTLAACSASGASSSSLPDVPSIHVPAGTATIEGSAAPDLTQRAPIAVQEVSRHYIDKYDAQFVERWSMAVTSAGTILVLDGVTSEITAFALEGEVLARPEVGEGSFRISSAGTGAVLQGWEAITLLDADGRIVRSFSPEIPFWKIRGFPDGTLVALEESSLTVTLVPPDGPTTALAVFPKAIGKPPAWARRLFPSDDIAVGGDRAYVTPAADYEVAAFSSSGEALWLLRVPWRRRAIPESEIQAALGRTRRAGRAMGTTVNEATIEWPTHYPALERLAADEEGRLYAFPHVPEPEQSGVYPVDVYAPDGRLLLHGSLPFQAWDASVADRIYRIEAHDGRSYVVTYRIELPDSAGSP